MSNAYNYAFRFRKPRRKTSGRVVQFCADTVRWRALAEARGVVLRMWVVFGRGGREEHWQVRRSVHGLVSQYDVVVDGVVTHTLGRRRVRKVVPGRWSEKGVSLCD
jgi:hypothetical protein